MFDVLGSMFDVQKRLLSVRGNISKTSACCRGTRSLQQAQPDKLFKRSEFLSGSL
jgi:hypothetical protein